MVLEEYVGKKAIDLAVGAATTVVRAKGGRIDSNEDNLEKCIAHHLKFVSNWSSEVVFIDLKKSKSTQSIYVPVDLYLSPRPSRVSEDEDVPALPLSKALDFREQPHVLLFGQPGAGKTTTIKHLCHEMLTDASTVFRQFQFPIVIRLREINRRSRSELSNPDLFEDILWSMLYEILGISILYPDAMAGAENKAQRSSLRKVMTAEVLDKLEPVIFLDGFDEIAHKTHRQVVLQEIRELGSSLNAACIILTSRTGDFNYALEGFVPLEIKSLNDSQVKDFAQKWLSTRRDYDQFLNQLYKSPYLDTAIRPLTLAHLCAIYERIGRIPEKPKTIYRKIVNLLIDEWDEQRSVMRGSRYAAFESDRKFEFLANLAYILTVTIRRTVFDEQHLVSSYRRINENFSLPSNEARKVVNEIESHTGLFVEQGYQAYEFSHKSLQEYLCAEYVVKVPAIPTRPTDLIKLPNELAIAVSISSNPSQYFCYLIFKGVSNLGRRDVFNFCSPFVNRLLIEKPDFYRSKEVGWALLILYSLYFDATVDSEPQLELFIFDALAEEFDALSELIKDRTSVEDIRKVYVESGREKLIDDTAVVILERMTKYTSQLREELGGEVLKTLPRTLRVRETLLTNGQANKEMQRTRKLAADF